MTQDSNMPDWDDLTDIWQQSPDIDMDKMARHARFVWWRMRINFLVEFLLCLGGAVFFLRELWIGPFADKGYFNLFFVFFCTLGMWAAVYIRQGAWGQPDGTALSLVELQIRRARSSIRYITMNNWGCLLGLPVFAVSFWVLRNEWSGVSDDKQLVLSVLIGLAAVFFVLFPILTRPYVKRKRAEIEKLEAVASQLMAAEADEG